MTTYSDKLKDPRWQKKRLKILERDEWACRRCGETEKQLHVHHAQYDASEPWEEKDIYLITLCEDCHDIEHEKRTETETMLLTLLRVTLSPEEVAALCLAMLRADTHIQGGAWMLVALSEWLTEKPERLLSLIRYLETDHPDTPAGFKLSKVTPEATP